MQSVISHQPSHHGATDIQQAWQLPEIPCTPPGPPHQFPEPEDYPGQARGRVTANTVGPQVAVTTGSDVNYSVQVGLCLLLVHCRLLIPYKEIR